MSREVGRQAVRRLQELWMVRNVRVKHRNVRHRYPNGVCEANAEAVEKVLSGRIIADRIRGDKKDDQPENGFDH